MAENSKKPRLRFKGFTETWEQREFGKVVNRLTEMACISELPRVEYEDIISGIGLLNKDITKKQSNKSGLLFSQGDILYGKLRPYLKNWLIPSFSGIAVGDFWVLKPENSDSGFIYRLIQTKQFDNVANQSTGTKMPRADWKLVSNTMFYVPILITEQVIIGRCFSVLDKLITLHQREENALFFNKISINLFLKVAFAWEQRELGKIGSTYTGLSGKSKVDFGHGKGKFITYMNVFTNPIANLGTVEPIEIDDKQNTVLVGDVFFTTSSETPEEVGMSCVLTENSPNTYLNSFCFGYRPIVKFDNYYLAYMLRSVSFRGKITFLAQGISRYNISKNKVMEIEIPIPDFHEQQKIGAYFRNIDNLITLHQRQLERLKNIKSALLEKMFV